VDEREVLREGRLDPAEGLEGDTWRARGSSRTPDGSANLEAQLTLMNARTAAAIAGDRERWPLAGDQIYVDLDLSLSNLPAGSRVQIGSAVIEFSEAPHTGCAKFSGALRCRRAEIRQLPNRARASACGEPTAASSRLARFGPGDTIKKLPS